MNVMSALGGINLHSLLLVTAEAQFMMSKPLIAEPCACGDFEDACLIPQVKVMKVPYGEFLSLQEKSHVGLSCEGPDWSPKYYEFHPVDFYLLKRMDGEEFGVSLNIDHSGRNRLGL